MPGGAFEMTLFVHGDGYRPALLQSEKPAERPTPTPTVPGERVRSQKAVKPPKPRKVEKKQRGRKG